jgi:protein-tyrosine phosphatase
LDPEIDRPGLIQPDLAGVSILVVCTANICRSPIAAGLLQARFGASGPRISSAGFLAGGRPADPFAVAAVREFGVDIGAHRSQTITATVVEEHDLVVTMTADHLRQVVDLAPRAWPSTFTWSDFTSRVARCGPRRSGEPFTDYITRLHAGRTAASVMSLGDSGDVADPFGGPRRGFDRTAALLDRSAALLVAALAGLGSVSGSVSGQAAGSSQSGVVARPATRQTAEPTDEPRWRGRFEKAVLRRKQ